MNISQKLLSSLTIALISTYAIADPWILNINNQASSTVTQLQLCYNQNTQCQKINPSSNSFTLDSMTTYQIKDSKQIYGSFQQEPSFFTLQETPEEYAAVWQDLKISYTSSNYSGWYQAVLSSDGKMSFGGNCQQDTGGITCNLSNSASGVQVDMTITGGNPPPTPPAPYTYDAGPWYASNVYAPETAGGVQLYPEVTYGSPTPQSYVGCYWTQGNVPTVAGGPWHLYDPNKNVCN